MSADVTQVVRGARTRLCPPDPPAQGCMTPEPLLASPRARASVALAWTLLELKEAAAENRDPGSSWDPEDSSGTKSDDSDHELY